MQPSDRKACPARKKVLRVGCILFALRNIISLQACKIHQRHSRRFERSARDYGNWTIPQQQHSGSSSSKCGFESIEVRSGSRAGHPNSARRLYGLHGNPRCRFDRWTHYSPTRANRRATTFRRRSPLTFRSSCKLAYDTQSLFDENAQGTSSLEHYLSSGLPAKERVRSLRKKPRSVGGQTLSLGLGRPHATPRRPAGMRHSRATKGLLARAPAADGR